MVNMNKETFSHSRMALQYDCLSVVDPFSPRDSLDQWDHPVWILWTFCDTTPYLADSPIGLYPLS